MPDQYIALPSLPIKMAVTKLSQRAINYNPTMKKNTIH